ncbi:hypothetical protein NKJ50_14740 [Mesorhizobium sp. M0115]|uniref:hypothetical protein n=1 Tax=unclassified Mesorhizobium TaxID=325217 RepID=UPI0033364C9C
MKKRESVDLLEGIPHFSPHDLRRSLTTILTDLKVRGDAASAVLDHSSGTPGRSNFRRRTSHGWPVPFKAVGQMLPLGRVLSLGQGDGVPQKASSQTPLWYQEMESKEAMKKSLPRPGFRTPEIERRMTASKS